MHGRRGLARIVLYMLRDGDRGFHREEGVWTIGLGGSLALLLDAWLAEKAEKKEKAAKDLASRRQSKRKK